MAYNYETIDCTRSNAILTATISNPPVNIMSLTMYRDLAGFTAEVAEDEEVKVVVLQSAHPGFFIAHFDIELILAFPSEGEPHKAAQLSEFHQMCTRLRTMPKATIAKIAGRAGGGGNEFASNCDMRFGVRNKTVINQMEVALGILPGGTGTQSLPRLVGRNRAMEMMLGSDDIDAETAERWGYLNRIFDTTRELDEFVGQFANRIASWPGEAIALCKQSINNAELPLEDGLLEEAYLFQKTLRTGDAQTNLRKAMDLGAQTMEGEVRIAALCMDVARAGIATEGNRD